MKKWRLVIVVLVFATLLLFIPTSFRNNLRNYTWVTLKPISFVFENTFGRATLYLKSIFHFNQIVKENSNLVTENLQLQSRLAKLSEMENENGILKKELNFMQTENLSTTTAAAVIGKSNDYLKSLVIDKGAENGITKGSAVISQGVLIGTIGEVRQNNSDINLITDYNSLVPVVLQDSRGTGLLRGGLGGLTVEDIPLNIGIKNNENVVTSSLGGQIPAGILIGKISETITKEGEIFQKATVTSLIDFSHLDVVFVIKNGT
jgi:rod shape-determining protein MreC